MRPPAPWRRKRDNIMNEFYTVKALLNAWRQLDMSSYPSDSKTPILSASCFADTKCAYVYFGYLPAMQSFSVALIYRKNGRRFEKECVTTDIHKAMKIAYLYKEELAIL